MSSKHDQVGYTVTAKAFHEGALLNPDDTFSAPHGFKASWAVPTTDHKPAVAEQHGDGFLDQTAMKIVGAIKDKTTTELKAYLNEEAARPNPRKSVGAAITDELANRVGKVEADPLS